MTNNNMKKQLLVGAALILLALLPASLSAQTTEGKDFWVTFLRADQNDVSDNSDKAVTLALTVSSRYECDVTFLNPYTGESKSTHLDAGDIEEVSFYTGRADAQARTRTDNKKASVTCYTFYPDVVDTCAIHVTSTAPISLFASNHREKSFDATNVLPTASLHSEYLIQSYPPSDHENKPQGTHFAIIAAEDNVTVDYYPTVMTKKFNDVKTKKDNGYVLTANDSLYLNFTPGVKCTTPVLMKGQVYYIWTGNSSGAAADLSGTLVKARDSKKIAVFQGAPHTNLPNGIRDRDHLFSQAMPTAYWGNTFAITASMTRHRDIIRVMATNDNTEVRINGDSVYTFDFANNPSRTFTFEIGDPGTSFTSKDKDKKNVTLPDPLVIGQSCFIETSCPAAVHLFMVSNQYDASANGDPAMLWVNPIEQIINEITFATYGSSNTHYFNVVTDSANVRTMRLDGQDISADFHPVDGSDSLYWYARKNISYASHTLKADSGFIAHVYGYGDKESYGYSAGGSTKVLTQGVTINGVTYSPDIESEPICEKEKVTFVCHLNYDYESITWGFGDGQTDNSNTDSIVHHYPIAGTYNAYVLIERTSSNVCVGQSLIDSIPLKVIIGDYKFEITDMESIPCKKDDEEMFFRVFYNNEAGINLEGDNTTLEFDAATIAAGFRNRDLVINQTDNYFRIAIPADVEANKPYGIHLAITDKCIDVDTVLRFMVSFDAEDVMVQRYTDVLGLNNTYFSDPDKTYSDFRWYRDSVLLEGENNSTLNLHGQPDTEGEYYVCYIINKGTPDELSTCSCPKRFKNNTDGYTFGDVVGGTPVQTSAPKGGNVFVNADYKKAGLTSGTATAEWLRMDGTLLTTDNLPDGGAIISAPGEAGLFILRVTTGKQVRNFKFIVY